MEESAQEQKAGWGRPLNGKKWHYFHAGEIISLCRKWMYAGYLEDEYDEHPENCKDCQRKLARIKQEGGK